MSITTSTTSRISTIAPIPMYMSWHLPLFASNSSPDDDPIRVRLNGVRERWSHAELARAVYLLDRQDNPGGPLGDLTRSTARLTCERVRKAVAASR